MQVSSCSVPQESKDQEKHQSSEEKTNCLALKSKNSKAEKRVIIDFTGKPRVIKQRNRLRKIETNILEAEFKKDPTWSSDQRQALAEQLNIS